MEHTNGHNEMIFSPTIATYVELLSAAGLIASAARGEQEQRRTLCTSNNAHASKNLNHPQRNVTKYRQQPRESRSGFHRTPSTFEPPLGPPLKQTRLEVFAYSHTMRDLSGHRFLESPETPQAPITPDVLTTSSSVYFDSAPIHMSRSPSILSTSHISTSGPLEPPNVISQSHSLTKHSHPPTILKLAKRLAKSPSQTPQLSFQELEAVDDQFSWLEDAMSEDDEDPFALDQHFTPKPLVPSRALFSKVDPDETPRLLPTTRTPLLSSQFTPRQSSTHRITGRTLFFDQCSPPRSPAQLQPPGPPPNLPLPSVPLHPPMLTSQPTTPRTPSRTLSRSRSNIEMPPVPPLPIGLGLGLPTPTKVPTGAKSPIHAHREGTLTANSVFRNRSHTSGVDGLPSQTKEDMTFLVEERHAIQTSRARAVSGGSGMSRGLMHNQRAEFRKKTATIPVSRYNTDAGRRESDGTSNSSTTGSEVELLQGEKEGTFKGRKGKRKIWR